MTTTQLNLLTITNASQLAEFCAIIIPYIWAGSLNNKRQQIFSSPKRHNAFKLFVQKVLKATQISCTCVILALHYIQRLRTAYPSIRASIGSEVRLFTTALVLANKYLDDNTFTNKTWSEVSSIPINELNIMEMEFLSALNYTIHIPHTQFFEWTNTCQQWYNKTMTPQVEAVVPQAAAVQPISLKRSYADNEEPAYNNKKRFMNAVPPITPVITQQVQQPFYSNNYNSIVPQQQQQQQQQQQKKFFSMDQLYYPSSTANLNTANYICKPILSWSSSVSALSSSKYSQSNNNSYYSLSN